MDTSQQHNIALGLDMATHEVITESLSSTSHGVLLLTFGQCQIILPDKLKHVGEQLDQTHLKVEWLGISLQLQCY